MNRDDINRPTAEAAMRAVVGPLVTRREWRADTYHLHAGVTERRDGTGAAHHDLPVGRLHEARGALSVSDGRVSVSAQSVVLCAVRNEGGAWLPWSVDIHGVEWSNVERGPVPSLAAPRFEGDALADPGRSTTRQRSRSEPLAAPRWIRELSRTHADLLNDDAMRDEGELLTRARVVDLLARLGRPVRARSIANYTSSPDRAPDGWPPPVRYVGRTPLWEPAAVARFARNRNATATYDEPPPF